MCFDEPQIRWLLQAEQFWSRLALKKKRGMLLAEVVSDFLRNIKSPNYEELGQILLTNFGAMSCNMSVQV